VIDLCPRGNLGEMLMLEKRFSEDRSKVYLAEILLAIEYLHSLNIIFRDLKPDNILVDEDGHLKLADFGLCKELTDAETSTFCGSPAYLAPEMVKKTGHGKALDWYLCGVLLFEMLTGAPPFLSSETDELYRNI
jgi:serum/glucocorticoid-regulated kinase 2